jgi:hypothetical protein
VANVLPFCSRATRCDVEVVSKNFSQFAVICAAVELPDADAAGADVAGAELEELPELPQGGHGYGQPGADASMIRRATSWNRMTRS